MFSSIVQDIKYQMRFGNNISKLILLNIAVFLLVLLIRVFTSYSSDTYQNILSYLALPGGSTTDLFFKPWTLVSHMFLHEGLWHLGWNMLILYWFGRIVGDLIGDTRIFSIYFLGGLSGAVFFLIFSWSYGGYSIALGASAAVMAFVVAAGFLAPEYKLHLILIGEVRMKYVVLAMIMMDVVLLAENNNSGGRIAHLGGACFGAIYVYLLRNGIDLKLYTKKSSAGVKSYKKKSSLKLVYKTNKDTKRELSVRQEKVDEILEKISREGFESLTDEEKEYLYLASKNS